MRAIEHKSTKNKENSIEQDIFKANQISILQESREILSIS